MRFFFYGTLTDADLREILLGRITVAPAQLTGWQRVALPGVPWPGIMPAGAAAVEGVVTGPLGPVQRRRLQRYEGNGYRLTAVAVETAHGSRAAGLFVPRRLPAPGEDWDRTRWLRRYKSGALRAVARLVRGRR